MKEAKLKIKEEKEESEMNKRKSEDRDEKHKKKKDKKEKQGPLHITANGEPKPIDENRELDQTHPLWSEVIFSYL